MSLPGSLLKSARSAGSLTTALAVTPYTLSLGGGLLSDRVFNDCCDFCVRVDDPKREIEACNEMTKRCKGDTAIEFAQANISNARFLLTAKESHDVMKEELADIQARSRSRKSWTPSVSASWGG